MGQAEIMELLDEKKRPMPAREIANELNDSVIKVLTRIGKMLEHGDIKFIEVDRYKARKYLKCKRKTRLYYSGEMRINTQQIDKLLQELNLL